MRASILVLIAAGEACHTPAPAPPAQVIGSSPPAASAPPADAATATGDLAHELAWARARWPRELGALDVGAPRERFFAWVPPGAHPLPVWVTTPQYTCARGELTHAADATPGEYDELRLLVYTKETPLTREYETASVANELWLGGSGGSETRGPNGWQSAGGWMQSDQGSWGHLSKVTDELAQFAGVWVDITAACGGPSTTLACDHGATLACSACTEVALTVKHREMGMIRHVYLAGLPDPSCGRCPEAAPNAELERVKALIEQIDPWVSELPESSTIYRSLERCRAAATAQP